MYTVPTMHATFVVHCRFNMKPLKRTESSNLQLCSSQSTNHSSWFGVRGPLKNTFAPSSHVCRSVPAYKSFQVVMLIEMSGPATGALYLSKSSTFRYYRNRRWNQIQCIQYVSSTIYFIIRMFVLTLKIKPKSISSTFWMGLKVRGMQIQ